MTARYFAGNSLAAFFRTSTATVEDTTAGRFDSAYVVNSIKIQVGSATDYIESWPFSATGTVWFRFDFMNVSGGIQNNDGARLMNGSTGVFRIAQTGSGVYQAQYWNGSAWTNTGSTFNLPLSTLYTIAVKVVLGSSFEAYSAGTLVASGSGWSGGGTTVTCFRGYNFATNGSGTFYSQVMVADYDLRDSHAKDVALNGNSAANTAGSGSYTDINETPIDESTAVVLASVGKLGQTKASITVPSGQGIGALVLHARGRVSGGTITDGKLGIRSGGTNYSSTGRNYNSGYEPRGYIVEADPATGGAWSQTSFNNAEIYEEAV